MMIQPRNPDPLTKRKISEMISEMAASFISGGKTLEEKENRPTAACSAWNMANGSPEIRRHQLGKYIEEYRRFNPATSAGDVAHVLKVMESLIERKLAMFPDEKRQIVSSKIVMVGKDYRIEVASANLYCAHRRLNMTIVMRWVATDVTTSPMIQREIQEFFKEHGVKSVALGDGNLGCPHEEGEDFPDGEDCPFAAFGKGNREAISGSETALTSTPSTASQSPP
jgi:hypothetical protein